jgi:N-acetylglucosamine-6-phosphate deacetylase
MLVTDAMPPVGGKRSTFQLCGNDITVRDGRLQRSDGTLAGAFLTMAQAVRNCVQLLGVPLTDALRFASANPANFLGLGDKLGRLTPNFRADIVAFEPNRLDIIDTWIAGTPA